MGTTFPGAAVVQLIAGDPSQLDAVVARLHPATVELTDTRVTATDGDIEWSWLLHDLEAVHHGTDGPWSIFVVPGVPDHGVALRPEDASEFRRLIDARHFPASQHQPPPAPSPPPPPASPGVVDLDAPDPAAAPLVMPEPAVSFAPTAEPAVAPPAVARPAPTAPRSARTTPTTLAGLEARNISAWFGSHYVLDRVSLVMPAGEVTALIGPSGCGKSTFLRILNRMHELIPSAALAGEVLLDGHDVYEPSRKITDARREIGMVFQKPNPFPAMSIYDNVIASLQLTGTKATADEKDEMVETCLSKAGLWNEVRDRLRQPGGGLSGGQQQRLCIARALAIRPRVLLMDEPCSALDPTSTRRIEQTIHELASEVTIVIVTHNMQQAQRVSHRCAFFLAEQGTPGIIVEHGPTEAMFSIPQDERTNDYVNGRFG
jgi:phosphate transport system ATP-binding protein